jgi:hypothetical protein
MFAIDKQYRDLESKLADEQDATIRARKESDMYKRKFSEAHGEKQAAF